MKKPQRKSLEALATLFQRRGANKRNLTVTPTTAGDRALVELQKRAQNFVQTLPTPEAYRKFFFEQIVPTWNEVSTVRRMCIACGDLFVILDARAYYCSDACQKKAAAPRRKGRRNWQFKVEQLSATHTELWKKHYR